MSNDLVRNFLSVHSVLLFTTGRVQLLSCTLYKLLQFVVLRFLQRLHFVLSVIPPSAVETRAAEGSERKCLWPFSSAVIYEPRSEEQTFWAGSHCSASHRRVKTWPLKAHFCSIFLKRRMLQHTARCDTCRFHQIRTHGATSHVCHAPQSSSYYDLVLKHAQTVSLSRKTPLGSEAVVFKYDVNFFALDGRPIKTACSHHSALIKVTLKVCWLWSNIKGSEFS